MILRLSGFQRNVDSGLFLAVEVQFHEETPFFILSRLVLNCNGYRSTLIVV